MRRSAANRINSVTVWRDSDWNQVAMEMGGQRIVRPSRRRWMKWEDPLRRFAQEELHYSWTQASAHRTDTWNEKAAAFATWFSKRYQKCQGLLVCCALDAFIFQWHNVRLAAGNPALRGPQTGFTFTFILKRYI